MDMDTNASASANDFKFDALFEDILKSLMSTPRYSVSSTDLCDVLRQAYRLGYIDGFARGSELAVEIVDKVTRECLK